MPSQPRVRRVPHVRRVGAVLAVALLAVFLAPVAHAAPPTPGYRVSLAPATVDAGAPATVTLTITNVAQRGRGLPLKAAVVRLPGVAVQSAHIVSGPRRFTVTPVDPETLALEAAGPPLLAGASVVVAIDLAGAAAGTYPLATSASGPAGKAFVRVGPDPRLTVGTTVSALAVTGQPTSTVTDTPVTPAVQVTARDAAGSPVAGVAVTLTYGTNPGGAAAPGGNTATTGVDGVGTFPDLTVPAPGIGYTLVAEAGALRSAPSDPFDVGASVTPCDPGAGCDSGTVAAPDESSRIRIEADAAGSSDALTAYFDDTRLLCQSAAQAFTATFNVDNRSKTITYTVAGMTSGTYHDSGPAPTVCFGSPTTFPVAGGGMAEFNEYNHEFEGLLPACAYYETSDSVTQPCVAGHADGPSGRVFTVLAPVGDPRMSH